MNVNLRSFISTTPAKTFSNPGFGGIHRLHSILKPLHSPKDNFQTIKKVTPNKTSSHQPKNILVNNRQSLGASQFGQGVKTNKKRKTSGSVSQYRKKSKITSNTKRKNPFFQSKKDTSSEEETTDNCNESSTSHSSNDEKDLSTSSSDESSSYESSDTIETYSSTDDDDSQEKTENNHQDDDDDDGKDHSSIQQNDNNKQEEVDRKQENKEMEASTESTSLKNQETFNTQENNQEGHGQKKKRK